MDKDKLDLIQGIVEEVINEVSIGYLKDKAKAVLDKRREDASHARKFVDKVEKATGEDSKHTKDARDQASEKSGRAFHAYALANTLKDGAKQQANRLVGAAKKVAQARNDHHWGEVEPCTTDCKKSYDRVIKAGALARTTDKKFKVDE